MSNNLNILTSGEIDIYIQSMREYDFQEIGSAGWLQWHKRLQELSQQAVIEAAVYREEYVKDVLINLTKAPVLVHEAIAIGIWRQKILPKLMKLRPTDCPTNLNIYVVLMHEMTSMSLLETVMFHADSCILLGDKIIDLIDYAVESICILISLMTSGYKADEEITNPSQVSDEDDFKSQQQKLQFQLGTICTSVLCYIVDHLPKLQVGVAARLVTVHDVPLLMTELLYLNPWSRRDKNGWYKYSNGKWRLVTGDAILKVGLVEGQVLICLRQLLLDNSVMIHYDLTDFRRRQLSKLQVQLNDVLIDQIPPLGELKHFVATLSLTGPASQPGKKAILLEIVPEIKSSLLNKYNSKWSTIAANQAEVLFPKDRESMMEIAKTLSASYSNEALEFFDKQSETKCGNCGKSANKKCSRCKGEWYCGRDCQLQRWALHKDICDQLVNEIV